MFSHRENVGANQKPLVPNRSSVDLVAATTTQYTGTRKYEGHHHQQGGDDDGGGPPLVRRSGPVETGWRGQLALARVAVVVMRTSCS